MQQEKRKEGRLAVKGNVFAALGRRYDKVGQIRDAGTGGLCFEYIGGKKSDETHEQIDIFCPGSEDTLYNIPCRVVYDRLVNAPRIDPRYVDSLASRRCGVEFLELSKRERERLDEFLEKYGVEA
jgi:hypothetical protein